MRVVQQGLSDRRYILFQDGVEQLGSEEFLCVSHVRSEPGWAFYDDSASQWISFIPRLDTDAVVAKVDFEYGLVGMYNFDGFIDGVHYGYVGNDLVFNSTVVSNMGTKVVSWGVSATYFCSLSSASVNRRRQLAPTVLNHRRLEALSDEAVLQIIVEVGLCDTHEFQWLGTCYPCAYTSCDSGYYLSPCDGLAVYDTSECVACTSADTCNATEFLYGTCDGTATIDGLACKACSECIDGLDASDGTPCDEACDNDPVFDNCPVEVHLLHRPPVHRGEKPRRG